MKINLKSSRGSRSQALVLVLLALATLSVIIIAFLSTSSLQSSVSRQDYQSQTARSMATMGLNSAVAQIRTALGNWDDPYNNFCGGSASSATPTFYWSVSPGIISRWSYTSTAPLTNYPLFSQFLYGETNLANLNVQKMDGSYPIIGGTTPPKVQVAWANVLKDPTQAPSQANPMVGRYAYWVDDESSKININTADGTMKNQTNSLGVGSPSEVTLQVLQQGGSAISTTEATNIVYLARTTGYNSVAEILRAAGSAPDLYTNNVANITSYSRSPDLNVFGQPKMAILPMLEDTSYSDSTHNTKLLNGITLRPLTEIYPTPSQLPPYKINFAYPGFWGAAPATTPLVASTQWPLAFRQVWGASNVGEFLPGVGITEYVTQYITKGHNTWMNGLMLAQYLNGLDALGNTITWPIFPNSSATGFKGKYSPRQLDSLVVQIMDFGAKLISPDYPFSSDATSLMTSYEGTTAQTNNNFLGRKTMTCPFLYPGWLSGQWVNGIGRTPRASAILMQLIGNGKTGTFPPPNLFTKYVPPSITADIWVEWWLPAGYLGGDAPTGSHFIPPGTNGPAISMTGWDVGYGGGGDVNLMDSVLYSGTAGAAVLPKADGTSSYWSNQLLSSYYTTTAGLLAPLAIDFNANAGKTTTDPDIILSPDHFWAEQVPGTLPTASKPNYGGAPAGLSYNSPFSVSNPQEANPSEGYSVGTVLPYDWAPGVVHTVNSLFRTPLYTKTNSDGTPVTGGNPVTGVPGTATISGGMTLNCEINHYGYGDDSENVPLESIRGAAPPGETALVLSGEPWTSVLNVGTYATLRDRVLASVVPVNTTVSVPYNSVSNPGIGTFVSLQPVDPLVNKFPGDWIGSSSAGSPLTSIQYSATTIAQGAAAAGVNSVYSEFDLGNALLGSTTSLRAKLKDLNSGWTDPDSYWVPQMDCGLSATIADLGKQTIIPRSARFPNVGYLQYVRTGIIPDDETVAYPSQKGTPFRLLSFAPTTDVGQTVKGSTYPDWALLDLFYVPSILAPFGGPYGYYDSTGTWQGFGNAATLAANSTEGGSTPGRINPNGSVLYTTSVTQPMTDSSGVVYTRTLPMQAVLQNIMVNQSFAAPTTVGGNPVPTGGSQITATLATTIAQDIATYVSASPLRMPGELCNVSSIASLRPAGTGTTDINPTRNDLMRQILGNLTTQSNVFSVWTVGQTIMKKQNASSYGTYESGDLVLGEVRTHYVIERYLDPGADGVIGNQTSTGTDGIAGTYDDPMDTANHPYCPHYLYRVVSVEEVR